MARLIPPVVDKKISSSAERWVFEDLKNDPRTDRWIVLHSLGLARRGRKPYGEIDFVVLIPQLGIACLEVKGGRVTCEEGIWTTTDRDGKKSVLKRSPFMQVRDGMFALREALNKAMGRDLERGLAIGCAVVFPDIEFHVTV